MLMLAMHPELQERVYEEVKTIPFAEGVDITHTDVSDLTYLDMFIKETMRMFPALSFLTRSVSKDIQIGKSVEFNLETCIKYSRSLVCIKCLTLCKIFKL